MSNQNQSRLALQDVSVNYGKRLALQNVSLEVKAGEILVIIGPNGAGKSTLIRAACGVIPLSSGKIFADGVEISKTSPQQRAKMISVVPQARNLPPAFTGWEIVQMGRTPYLGWLGNLSETDEAIIRSSLERTGCLELADRPVGELSGGEQQRLLISRAIAQQTPIMLLDEPTAHLDLQHQITLLDLVRQFTRQDGMAVVLALHDLNLAARYGDRIGMIVHGRLIALDTPDQVLQADFLSQIYHIPMRVGRDELKGYPVVFAGD